jgi:hypothetical protein
LYLSFFPCNIKNIAPKVAITAEHYNLSLIYRRLTPIGFNTRCNTKELAMLLSQRFGTGLLLTFILAACNQGKTYTTSGIASGDATGGAKLAVTLPASTDATHYSIESTPSGCSYTEKAVVTRPYSAAAEGFLYPGCDHSIKVTLGIGSDAGGESGALVSYDGEIAPYVNGKCALSGCHDGTTPPSLKTYDELKAEAETAKNRMKSTGTDSMPPGAPAAAADVAMFESWIAGGMPQAAAALELAGVSYTGQVKAFYDANCTAACHKAGSAEGDLTTFELLTANANDMAVKSIAQIEGKLMPPGKETAATDLEMLKTWQTDGFPLGEGGEAPAPATPAPKVTPPKEAPLTTVYYESTANVTKADIKGNAATGPKLKFTATQEGKDKGLPETLE